MLSIERLSTDPPCPQQKPCNERASHKRGLPVSDLSKAAIFKETSFSKFSIREYVLSSRSKDIKANWPFSSKSLQLCLKHGVKDLLPPFQPLLSVKAPSFGAYNVENAKPESRSMTSVVVKPARCDNHGLLKSPKFAKLNEKQRQTCIESNSCRFGGGNDLQSTTTSLSPSEIDLIPTLRSSNSPLEFDGLSRKTARMAKPLGKKCRFPAKYGAQACQASGEDNISNSTTTSETMASKTCPVCKTFSSPSNTTLNAHIDQCLSVDSTPKWSLDSKAIKHKFKPRKTKLLVDIYTTALPCTLEDLDRRNGTSWAIASRPTPDIEKSDMHSVWKRDSRVLAHPKITNEDGVYFDAKGTKLRILSAFHDESRSKLKDNLGSSIPKKEDEGKKFKLLKRQKNQASKHRKFRKFAGRRIKISPQKDPTSQIDKGRDGYNGLEEGCKTDKHQMKSGKPHDSGCLRQWVCSKRTGVAKKCKWLVPEDLSVQSDQTCFDVMKNEKTRVLSHTNSSENPKYFLQDINVTETDRSLYGDGIINHRGLIRDVNFVYELNKGKPSTGDGFFMKPPNLNGACVILSKDCQASVLKSAKFYEPSENMSSFSKSLSKSGSKSPLVKKRSALTKNQTGFRVKMDEKIMILDSETDRSSESWSERVEIATGMVEVDENGRRPLGISLTSLSSGSPTSKHCDDDNLQSSVHGGLDGFHEKMGIESAGEVVQIRKESPGIKSSSKATSLAISLNPNVHELVNSSMPGSGLLRLSISRKQPAHGAEEQDLETKLEFDDDRQESTAMIRYSAHETGELASSFDPILIPGPPGSFLPSPGTMQSDEFQGNSSLTSSQAHSDEQDFTDGDSSDFPISSSSTFSTFTAARLDLDYFAPAQPHAFDIKPRSVLSGHDLAPSMENTTTGTNRERLQVSQTQRFGHPSFANPCCDRQMGDSLHRRLKDLDIPPLCCCSRTDKATSPMEEWGVKLPDCGNFESATSSSSNPVLRLMGKNLMVMNTSKDASCRAEQTKPSSLINHNSGFAASLNSSSGSSANKETHLFHRRVGEIDDKTSWNYTGSRHFDVRTLDGFRTHLDLKTSQTFIGRSEVLLASKQTNNGGLVPSIEPPRSHQMNANSRACPIEEFHTIVDGPNYSRNFGTGRKLTPGIQFPVFPSCDTPCYQQEHP